MHFVKRHIDLIGHFIICVMAASWAVVLYSFEINLQYILFKVQKVTIIS